MKIGSPDLEINGLSILARIIARKFMANQQAKMRIKPDLDEKSETSGNQITVKEGDTITV